MRRHGNLFEQWCNYENFYEAYKEVRKGKTNYRAFIKFENKLAANLERIYKSVLNGTYKVKPYRVFTIQDPKERVIHAPHLEDRIVQHAIIRTIRPLVENRFITETFACIKERGTHKASDKLVRFLQVYKDTGYYLKIDIEKYFYRINHETLKAQLRHILKCRKTLEYLSMFIQGENGMGLPLGNVTSQLLANLALSPLDHFIKRVLKAKHYLRYMDDMLILSKCKTYLRLCLARIKEFVKTLKLKTNSKTKISRIKDGIDFVGYKTWYNYRLIRKRSLKKFYKAIKDKAGINAVQSFYAHAKHTLSVNKLKNYEILYG